jgi:hypothetical protein
MRICHLWQIGQLWLNSIFHQVSGLTVLSFLFETKLKMSNVTDFSFIPLARFFDLPCLYRFYSLTLLTNSFNRSLASALRKLDRDEIQHE